MDNDLSLSQSLGGLRIANPDHQSTSTPLPHAQGDLHVLINESSPPISREVRSATDPQSQLQSRRHSIFNILRRGESATETTSATYSPPLAPERNHSETQLDTDGSGSFRSQNQSHKQSRAQTQNNYRQSMPLNHQLQQQAQFPSYRSNSPLTVDRGLQSLAGRPVSGMYSAHPPPNAISTREPGSYRVQSDMSDLSTDPNRRESRAGTAMQAGVPSRELSHRERSYNQNPHNLPGNGPVPPRRSSSTRAPGVSNGVGSALPPMVNATSNGEDAGAANITQQEYDTNGRLVLRQVKKGVKDFAFSRTLGEGSYSTVVLGTDRQTLKEYAVKILDKKHIIKEKKIKYVNIERDTLNRLIEHPGIVRLYYTFQDNASLYYVLDIASGGELLAVLKKIGSFNEECTRFYGAQIVCAIEHMHDRGVIHRDLKPENVLLDDQMHIKITDFGTAKLLPDPRDATAPQGEQNFVNPEQEESNRARSFVGTAEYVSPELLRDKHACKSSDLWAFGCMIYQLLAGRPPFKASNEYQTFQKIVNLEYEFPPGFPHAAKDLVERLLVLDPQRRLSIEHIKNHEFFDGVKFGRSLWRLKAPRLMPYVAPTHEPTLIKLNGGQGSVPQPITTSRASQVPGPSNNGTSRPQPRIITELPPPTQLDIEWMPVLTRDNERILKLGNLMVLSAPLPHSPGSRDHGDVHEKKGLARFFGGSTTKKRQRLVMVTSSGRIILAAAGGGEKKSKQEISLLASECSWRIQLDAKGQTVWCVDVRGVHYTFEDPKTSSSSNDLAKSSAEEWIESIERAKDMVLSQNTSGSYSTEPGFDMQSSISSPASTLHGINQEGFNINDRSGRNNLTRSQDELPEKAAAKRNRFSKRASKNGLSTPF
ncbi:kinase-like domain-containing protein [Calycina marina]|uniref:non-specific serine/threonine protein kinase n=1 Tax=Calycina marina TaxID=1763456 RepID=A0A9P7Z184_9HELO|nr:kinase-like domain-containing protein [Calycina marina]